MAAGANPLNPPGGSQYLITSRWGGLHDGLIACKLVICRCVCVYDDGNMCFLRSIGLHLFCARVRRNRVKLSVQKVGDRLAASWGSAGRRAFVAGCRAVG